MRGIGASGLAVAGEESSSCEGKRTDALSSRETDVVKVLAEGLTKGQEDPVHRPQRGVRRRERVRMSLSRRGRVVGRGTGSLRRGKAKISLAMRRRARPGRYTLTVAIPSGSGKAQTVRQRISIR